MWLRHHLLTGVVCLTVALAARTTLSALAVPKTAAFHPARRVDASPVGGRAVAVNPPPLLWPVTSGRDVRYQVRLSQDERFSPGATIEADGLGWAMFNPHQKLGEGTWFWQYGATRRPGEDVEWSGVFRFHVDGSARVFVTPSAAEMIRGVPRDHPRILVSPDKLDLLRDRLQQTDFLKGDVRSAEKLVGQPIRGVEAALPTRKGASQYETKNFANLMLAFRSSPFGSFNHMHSDQNSFNILFGGQRLFSGSGYYIAYGDEHFKNWYTHTRGHNSILIDDHGQVRGPDGYGSIARYLHGRQISYSTGDASNAYGDAGLTRFRRHVVFLRPGVVVVYDNLEADHAARWSWLLHSPGEMTANPDQQRLLAAVDTSRAQVDLFGTGSLRMTVSDRFDPPAVNWRNRTSGGAVVEYPNQWHATVVPAEKLTKARFLAIFQIHSSASPQSPATPVDEPNGAIRVAGWRITAALDPSRDASLLIERTDGKAALAVDCPVVSVGGTQYELLPSESLLVEDAGKLVERCLDEPLTPKRSIPRRE